MATDPLSKLPEAFIEPVESFLAWLELERGLSANTIAAYGRDLAQYAQFLKQQGVDAWTEVDESAVSAWNAHLSEAEYARSSQARKLSAIRMLARHLVREGIRKDDFTELVSAPKLNDSWSRDATSSWGRVGTTVQCPRDFRRATLARSWSGRAMAKSMRPNSTSLSRFCRHPPTTSSRSEKDDRPSQVGGVLPCRAFISVFICSM